MYSLPSYARVRGRQILRTVYRRSFYELWAEGAPRISCGPGPYPSADRVKALFGHLSEKLQSSPYGGCATSRPGLTLPRGRKGKRSGRGRDAAAGSEEGTHEEDGADVGVDGPRVAGGDAVYGGLGDDRVLGGTGNDYVEGDYGHDYINTGTGSDKVAAKDGYRDRIICGQGNRDKVYKDKKDRTRGCEIKLSQKPRP